MTEAPTIHPYERQLHSGFTEKEIQCTDCGNWFFQFTKNGYTLRRCPVCHPEEGK